MRQISGKTPKLGIRLGSSAYRVCRSSGRRQRGSLAGPSCAGGGVAPQCACADEGVAPKRGPAAPQPYPLTSGCARPFELLHPVRSRASKRKFSLRHVRQEGAKPIEEEHRDPPPARPPLSPTQSPGGLWKVGLWRPSRRRRPTAAGRTPMTKNSCRRRPEIVDVEHLLHAASSISARSARLSLS